MNQIQTGWKHKYLDSLDELERKEQSWKQVEGFLRKAISRLTLIATDSHHENLKHKLAELRTAIRKNSSHDVLQTIIDDLSELIQHLDEQQPEEYSSKSLPKNFLLELLELFEFPQGAVQKSAALKKKITSVKNDEELKSVLPEFANLFEETFNILLQDEFRKRQPDKTLPESSPFLKRLLEQRSDKKTKQVIDKKHLIAPAAGELVLQLILRLPDSLQAKLQIKELKRKITQTRSRSDLVQIVEKIAANYSERSAKTVKFGISRVSTKQFYGIIKAIKTSPFSSTFP